MIDFYVCLFKLTDLNKLFYDLNLKYMFLKDEKINVCLNMIFMSVEMLKLEQFVGSSLNTEYR